MDRPSKLIRLNQFRRQLPHITAQALEAVLVTVKKDGVPDLDKRSQMREARNLENNAHTPYGTIMQTVTVTTNTGSTHEVPVANPFALLWTSVDGSPNLKALLLERLAVHPSSLESPWHLVLYSDEVTPGNVLACMNRRKFQAVYFSFLELGATAFSHEESWWCVLVEFSKVINDLSAMMSQMFAKILKLFFNPEGLHLTNTGVNLPVTEDGLRLFAVLGAFLQDGGAHKSTWHCRGDGASKPCLLCKNLFTESSNVCDEDGTNLLRCNVIKKG